MAISPSGFDEYQKNLLDKKVSEIVEVLDKKIIERAKNKLVDILKISYYEPKDSQPLTKVCEGVCEEYLKNGWFEVGYKIEKQKTDIGEYIVVYVFLRQENKNAWGGIPESKEYTMLNRVKTK
jgi:hypothetical protein